MQVIYKLNKLQIAILEFKRAIAIMKRTTMDHDKLIEVSGQISKYDHHFPWQWQESIEVGGQKLNEFFDVYCFGDTRWELYYKIVDVVLKKARRVASCAP